MWNAGDSGLYETPGAKGGGSLSPRGHPQEVGLPGLEITHQIGVVGPDVLGVEERSVSVCGPSVAELQAKLQSVV